jgi:hypothetical protein
VDGFCAKPLQNQTGAQLTLPHLDGEIRNSSQVPDQGGLSRILAKLFD